MDNQNSNQTRAVSGTGQNVNPSVGPTPSPTSAPAPTSTPKVKAEEPLLPKSPLAGSQPAPVNPSSQPLSPSPTPAKPVKVPAARPARGSVKGAGSKVASAELKSDIKVMPVQFQHLSQGKKAKSVAVSSPKKADPAVDSTKTIKPPVKKKKSKLTVFLIVLVSLLFLGSIAFAGYYFWWLQPQLESRSVAVVDPKVPTAEESAELDDSEVVEEAVPVGESPQELELIEKLEIVRDVLGRSVGQALLSINKQALEDPEKVDLKGLESPEQIVEDGLVIPQHRFLAPFFSVQPVAEVFKIPAVLSITYQPDKLGLVKAEDLAIGYWEDSDIVDTIGHWVIESSSEVDSENNLVTAEITQFADRNYTLVVRDVNEIIAKDYTVQQARTFILDKVPLSADQDQDGLTDKEELEVFATDATQSDSDSDTFADLTELQNGYDPLAAGQKLSFDNWTDHLNLKSEYFLKLPPNWEVVKSDDDYDVLVAPNGQFVIIMVQANSAQQPLVDWYQSQKGEGQVATYAKSAAGLEGLVTSNSLNYYLALDDQVFVFSYGLPAGSEEISYQQTLNLIVKNFRAATAVEIELARKAEVAAESEAALTEGVDQTSEENDQENLSTTVSDAVEDVTTEESTKPEETPADEPLPTQVATEQKNGTSEVETEKTPLVEADATAIAATETTEATEATEATEETENTATTTGRTNPFTGTFTPKVTSSDFIGSQLPEATVE